MAKRQTYLLPAGSPMLANPWDTEADPTGWWVSEKLDGIRAVWDGLRLLTRNGHEIFAPEWFLSTLPPTHALDGELWLRRGGFQELSSVVRRNAPDARWSEITYRVFDIPDPRHDQVEDRLWAVRSVCGEGRRGAHVVPVEQTACTSRSHLDRMLQAVLAAGGEGLMLRMPRSYSIAGRSDALRKLKSMQDAEARVVGHIPGAGKHLGRLGALLVELPSGKQFCIGTGFSDEERESPPAIGEDVSFSYQELTNEGVPRFPVFRGVRIDT